MIRVIGTGGTKQEYLVSTTCSLAHNCCRLFSPSGCCTAAFHSSERARPSPATFLREGVLCEYPDQWDSEIATSYRSRRCGTFSVRRPPQQHDWTAYSWPVEGCQPQMRAICLGEMDSITQRRGLRNRVHCGWPLSVREPGPWQ